MVRLAPLFRSCELKRRIHDGETAFRSAASVVLAKFPWKVAWAATTMGSGSARDAPEENADGSARGTEQANRCPIESRAGPLGQGNTKAGGKALPSGTAETQF